MDCEYTIYIDEAGDDGLGKLRGNDRGGQSLWFVVGALCVRNQNDKHVVSWRDEISQAFSNRQRRDIHFKHLKHQQRRHACRVIASKPVRIAAALSNKVTLLDLPPERLKNYKQKNHLHNYVCRWLLERVSSGIKSISEARDEPQCRAKVVFSRRGGMNYDEFRSYLQLIKDGKEIIYSPGKIDWDVIDPARVDAQDHSVRAGLQLADISTSAIFHAVEPNPFGFTETGYADELRRVILRQEFKDGTKSPRYNCGITHIPNLSPNSPLSSEQRSFFDSWK